MKVLDGHTALITGASTGIGWAIAECFARAGANLVLVDSTPTNTPNRVQSCYNISVEMILGDVAEVETWQRAITRTETRFGQLNILVNNAHWSYSAPVTELDVAEWRRTLDVCLTGTFLGMKYALPLMLRLQRGAIINLSTVNAFVATPGIPAYIAAKGGITALTRQVAVEYGPFGIRTNAIAPGLVVTDRVKQNVLSDPAEIAAAIQSCPLRRVGTPEEIAEVALFLAGDAARYMNGQVLVIDGGTSSQWQQILVRPSLRKRMGLSDPVSMSEQKPSH